MYSLSFSMRLTVAVFSGFVFYVACRDSHRECFDVESRTICYFMPNVSSDDWDTAWKTCRELDATLPVILNEKEQRALVDYLTKNVSVQAVWTAGRYVGNRKWRWLNNQIVKEADEPKCPQRLDPNEHCLYETQAVLTRNLTYKAIFPDYDYNYICNFSANHCTTESQKSISWKGGCLSWTKNFRLPVNRARNECLKGGGDLATFSDDGDLQDLKQFSSVVKDADDKGYLIGLHWKWWIWNTTDVHDIKYNLLNDYGELGKDCLFINESSKWNRDKCSVNKSVICQTEKRNRSSTDALFTETVTVLTASPVETSIASSASTGDSDIPSPVETSTTSSASTEKSRIFTSTSSKRGNQATSTRASAILHVTSTWSQRENQNTSTSESVILHVTSTWSQRENQRNSTSESVVLHDFSTERLVAIITGVTVGLVIFIVALIFSCRKLCKKKTADEKDRQSGEKQTQATEYKGTDEICGFYAEVTRTVHDEEQGDNANEPQTSIVYATLEFESNKVPKEEPITSNPHELDVVSDPAEAVPPDAIG